MAFGILAFMADDWHHNVSVRKQQLLSRLALYDDVSHVVYVAPWRMGAAVSIHEFPEQNMTVVYPSESVLKDSSFLENILNHNNADDYIVWMQFPLYIDALLGLDPLGVVYDCTDDYSSYFSEQRALFLRADEMTLRKADYVFAASRWLYEQKSLSHKNVHFIPNGVDLSLFDPDKTAPVVGSGQWSTSNFTVGYVGRINTRVNSALVASVASRLPEVDFVFVGPIHSHQAHLDTYENIHLLGIKEYNELPYFISSFDICWIPHLVDDATISMNPGNKVFEYMAMNKLVISTLSEGMSELTGGLVCVADEQDLVESISRFRSMEKGALRSHSRTRNLVLGMDWGDHARQIKLLLDDLAASHDCKFH